MRFPSSTVTPESSVKEEIAMATEATEADAAAGGEEEQPKKKKPILLILGIAVIAIVVMVGVAFGTLYFSGYYEKKAELAAMDKLEELEAAATKAKDEAPAKLKKEAPEATRFEKNYFQIEKELMTNITGSKKVMVVQIAVMTHYDSRVFDNIKKHEFALRSAMLDLMRQTTEAEANKPEFRKELAVKLKDVMNSLLEEYEDFGGIEEVMFTSFVMQ
jgi:flagellar FliL protein